MHIGTIGIAVGGLAMLAAFWAGCSAEQTPQTNGTPEAGKKTPQTPGPGNVIVVMETSEGTVRIELLASQAPKSVANFLRYADEKHYDYTIFHRVIATFMIQGGGFDPDMKQKPTHEPIVNEAGNGLKNLRGTLAMARTNEVNSATAQFFISVVDNGFLDHSDETPRGFGYAVFARVVEGMDVVDRIRDVATHTVGGHDDVPRKPVIIKSIRRAGA